MKRILITGFGPFPGVPDNISGRLAKRVARDAQTHLPDLAVSSTQLPTEWRRGLAKARTSIARLKPDVVLHFGVSSEAQGFVLERRGVNVCVSAPDGAGQFPQGPVQDADGPKRRPATVPIATIIQRLKALGLPAVASSDAGEYLCNAVLYQSLSLAADGQDMMVGFIHIPTAFTKHPTDGLSLERAVFGALDIIAACVETKHGSNRARATRVA